MKRPNIIVYFSDQQRWDTLGCSGQPVSYTHLTLPTNSLV